MALLAIALQCVYLPTRILYVGFSSLYRLSDNREML
jgi:hypothetical protein